MRLSTLFHRRKSRTTQHIVKSFVRSYVVRNADGLRVPYFYICTVRPAKMRASLKTGQNARKKETKEKRTEKKKAFSKH